MNTTMLEQRVLNITIIDSNDEFLIEKLKGYINNKSDEEDEREENSNCCSLLLDKSTYYYKFMNHDPGSNHFKQLRALSPPLVADATMLVFVAGCSVSTPTAMRECSPFLPKLTKLASWDFFSLSATA